jgi:hypothetical protein
MFWSRPPKSLHMWLSGAHTQWTFLQIVIKTHTTDHTEAPPLQISLGARSEKRFQAPPPPHASSAMRRISKAPPPSSWLYTQLVSSMFKAVACIDAWAALPASNWNHANFFAPLTGAVSKDTLDSNSHTQHRARVSTGYELTPKRQDSANLHIGPVWHLGVNANLWLIPWYYASTLGYIHAWPRSRSLTKCSTCCYLAEMSGEFYFQKSLMGLSVIDCWLIWLLRSK